MKAPIKIVPLVLFLASQSLAGFNIPRNVYRINQLDSAKSEAQLEGKAITFLYTDSTTTCPHCIDASLGVINGLRSKSVVIYVDERKQLPKFVQDATRTPEAGRYIPKAVVVDPAITTVIAIVPYAKGTEQKRLLRDAKKAISEAISKKRSPIPQADLQQTGGSRSHVIQPDENREMRTWESQRGAEIQASLVKEIGTYVVLKKENGMKVMISLGNLRKEDQEYVAKLKASGQEDVQPSSQPDNQ